MTSANSAPDVSAAASQDAEAANLRTPDSASASRAKTGLGLAAALALVMLATVLQSVASLLAHGDVQTFTLFYPAILLSALFAGRKAGSLAVAAAAVSACTLLDRYVRVHVGAPSEDVGLAMFVLIGAFIVEVCHRLIQLRRQQRIINSRLREEIHARHAAHVTEARLAAIVSSSDDAIVGKKLDGTITSWNQAAEKLFGYSAAEAMGNSIYLIIPSDRHDEEKQIISRVRAGLHIDHFQTVRRTKSGKLIDVSVTISPIYDDAGKVVGASKIARDIGALKQADRERIALLDSERFARSEAERAGHLKDEFLATLSHELRTPLNAILGWTQILRGGTRSEEDLASGLETIERNARVQTQIIEDLLDMSRIIAGEIRLDVARLDLVNLINEAVESVRPAIAAKGIRLVKVLDSRTGLVSGDSGRLQQIFWNLLSNAIKFTPRGGKIEVLLQRVDSHLQITVSDSGQGISPDFLPYIFDRFRQQDAATTRRHGGLGLGLSIVKQLVELHGGTIRPLSDGEGRGATFIVKLPMTAVREQPRRAPRDLDDSGNAPCEIARASLAAAAAKVSLERIRVLVVDDEADAREVIRCVLRDCHAAVTTACDASEAMDVFRQNPPDVLVSDIGMPEKDGYQLIREIRRLPAERGGRTPAIALTAFARSEDRTRAILSGYQVHLAKPIEPQELVAVVASLSGQMWNESPEAPEAEVPDVPR